MRTTMQRKIEALKKTAMGAVILTAILLAACSQSENTFFGEDSSSAESMPSSVSAAADTAAQGKSETDALDGELMEPVRESAADRDAPQEQAETLPESEAEVTAPAGGETASEPQPTEPRPAETPTPAAEPEPTPAPEPAPEPVPEATPAPAYGAIPFEVAAGTGKWWSIDSSDSAYWAMQEQINAVRAAGGLPALTMDGNLSAIASSRCESFVAGGPFDHSGMVTTSEICAAGPLGSASAACAAWIASDVHYANIMRTDITSMGVSCWFCDESGNRYTYWTVTFG